MSNREKIILVITGVAIIYGIYNLFFVSSPKMGRDGPEKSIQENNKFVMDIAQRLQKNISSKQSYVLALAKSKWSKDPFMALKPALKDSAQVQSPESNKISRKTFAYTGYLEMGDRKLAIINGLEYQSGDRLEQGGNIVKKIGPRQVVIGPQNSSKDMVLKLEETK